MMGGSGGHLRHQRALRSDKHLGHEAREMSHMCYSHLNKHNGAVNVQMNL